ncbi:hypothetical protein J2X20_000347 [Pelomonas saccharophila]|uniref:DUF3616 domain-containing protein n=1 Tax=Roseateles saccharophilus TaxID=304 RepID=A0ABU1YG51_ROSSA|nr:DUF3616 domain-containing protein [Roseateles saccharophilus]MDR7267718.1 hypothetical protein [Roseateles saccharophilus]
MRRLAALLLIAAGAAGAQTRYEGLCDASAAVALDARHFIVADDEHNRLTIYRRGEVRAVSQVDLDKFLKADKEADLEGAAQVGNRIYWIASHARNSAGKVREDRQRFFATEIRGSTIEPIGKPYTVLLADLLAAAPLAPLKLSDAAGRAAEAMGGFNIEGLAAAPDGSLLIGLRNPIPQGRALIIPLLNPAALVEGKGPARFGSAIRLDLGGRGVRSLERIGNGYLIVAGPTGDEGTFALFRWSGKPIDMPVPVKAELGTLRPEALFAWPDGQITLLSDDGGVMVGNKACKDADKGKRTFRALDVKS